MNVEALILDYLRSRDLFATPPPGPLPEVGFKVRPKRTEHGRPVSCKRCGGRRPELVEGTWRCATARCRKAWPTRRTRGTASFRTRPNRHPSDWHGDKGAAVLTVGRALRELHREMPEARAVLLAILARYGQPPEADPNNPRRTLGLDEKVARDWGWSIYGVRKARKDAIRFLESRLPPRRLLAMGG